MGNNFHMEDLIKTFTELVRIKGLSGEENNVANYIKNYLMPLGLKVEERDLEKFTEGKCGNIIATYKDGGEIALCAHMDTARNTENVNVIIENGMIKSDGKQQLGADCRLGIAVILSAVKDLIENNKATTGFTLIFTSQEETTMNGSKNITVPNNVKHIFIMDSAWRPGFFIYGAPGAVEFKLELFGKSAHAGIEPEKGINVIKMLGDILVEIPQGRVDDESTINVAIINAGSAINVVPDYALVRGEIRSFKEEKVEEYINLIDEVCDDVTKRYNASYNFEYNWDFKPYTFTKEDEAYRIIYKAIEKNGLVPKPVLSYGGSDVNNFNERGYKAINVGTGAQNPHSNDEFVLIEDMEKDVNLCKILLTNKFI
ncbi:MAG TPA: M20/M25/M40 family metallo-hydrolase [Ignavibacteriales bacterium]|nr:M20/M25/M40 family metallo-hydrolase [Ignavibacteriales bacterium]